MKNNIYKQVMPDKINLAPREKLEQNGVDILNNAELMSIILGVGSRKESVKDMSSRVIKDYGVSALAAVTDYRKLQEHLGLGRVKSMQVLATLELGRRLYLEKRGGRALLNSPEKIFQNFRHLGNKDREELRILYLNSRQFLIVSELMAIGSISFVLSRKRDIIAPALEYDASGIILLHNHPSQNVTPSKEDIDFTKSLEDLCKLFEINILDHVIISRNNFYSFRSNGLLSSDK